MECSEKSFILQGRSLIGHQVTGDTQAQEEMVEAPSRCAAAKRPPGFSGLLDTCEARWASNGMEHTTVTTTKTVRVKQSKCYRYALHINVKLQDKGHSPTFCSLINGCTALSPTGGRIPSHHPHNQLSIHSRLWLT